MSKKAAKRTCAKTNVSVYSVTRGVMVKRKHFLSEDIEKYLRNKVFPSNIAAKDYGSKSNFRRATRKYSFKDGDLFDKIRIVIKDRNRQMEIIRDVHSDIGNSEHSKAVASHRGKILTYEKIAQRFFRCNIFGTTFQMILVTLLRNVSCAQRLI